MKRVLAVIVGALVGAGLVPTVPAESGGLTLGTNEAGRVLMKWDDFKKVTQWDNRALPGDADKDRFTVTWKEVQDLLGIQIKDVDTAQLKLPWKEFKALLEWSVQEADKKKKDKEKVDPSPVPYLVMSAEYMSAEVGKEGAVFTGKFKINVLEEKGWKKIDILPANVAISEVKLPDGVFLQLAGGYYSLLTKKAGLIEAELSFSAAVTESGGAYMMSFPKVPSGTCVLDLTVPAKDVDVRIAGAQSKLVKATDKGTRVVAALPANSAVNVSWERAVPETAKVPTKLYSETRTLVSVADGLILGSAQVSFSILHTPTRQLEMTVPAGVSVLEVTGRQIRDWRVNAGKLTVQLEKDVIGLFMVDVKYEISQAMASGKTVIPVITGVGVEREKGHIAVVALSNVEIKSDAVTGAHPMDVKDLPPEIVGMTSQPILLAYRYVDPKFQVGLQISKHADVDVLLTVIDRVHFTVMQTFDGKRITRAVYNVRNSRNQFLRLQMPAEAEIWSASVAGRATQPAKDTEGRIILPLVRSDGAGGMSSFPVELVYAEQGTKPDARGAGTAKVTLPACAEPVMHMTAQLYVPNEGRYDDFDGSLRPVTAFTPIGGKAVAVDANAAQALQMTCTPPAAGASPIEVQLPVSGKVYLFEKILAVKDAQWFSYSFSRLRR